jgi:hypothetical protein
VAYETGDVVRFKQSGNAACQLPDDSGFALLHLRDIDCNTSRIDAVLAEFMLCPVVEFGGFQQCF